MGLLKHHVPRDETNGNFDSCKHYSSLGSTTFSCNSLLVLRGLCIWKLHRDCLVFSGKKRGKSVTKRGHLVLFKKRDIEKEDGRRAIWGGEKWETGGGGGFWRDQRTKKEKEKGQREICLNDLLEGMASLFWSQWKVSVWLYIVLFCIYFTGFFFFSFFLLLRVSCVWCYMLYGLS